MVVRHSLGLLCLAALLALLGLGTASGGSDYGTMAAVSVGCFMLAAVLTTLALWRLFRYLNSE